MSLAFRLKRRWDMSRTAFANDLKFSSKLAWCRLVDDFLTRCGMRKLSDRFYKIKENIIQEYLKATIKPVIEKYRDVNEMGQKVPKSCIWVCWWTGLDSAPALVKRCINSIVERSGSHPVHIITKDNYEEFLNIPEYLLERLRSQEIGLAHFADYLRVCLLYKYGGLWLDATIFCADRIPEDYFEVPFFTCKSEYQESKFISHYQWVTFVLGGWKGNVFYAFMKEAFEIYWENNTSAIDYLFFDELIYIARENVTAIKQMMDCLPVNTPHRDDLQAAFNDKLGADNFSKIIKTDTPIYKLSWREQYKEINENGEPTVYARFINKRG